MVTKRDGRTRRKPAAGKAPVAEAQQDAEAQRDKDTALTEFMDHQKKAFAEAGKALESLFPVAFKEHGLAALKEVVEGYRKLLNSALDEIVKTVEKFKTPEEPPKNS